jgi:hypothetical protein
MIPTPLCGGEPQDLEAGGTFHGDTGVDREGKCPECRDTMALFVRPLTGEVVGWCCRCDREYVVATRRAA